MDERRVALLVDGENLSAEVAGFLITTAAKCGALTIKRVFGAVTRLGGWTTAPGFRVVHVPPKKDAADLALSLDALELALTRQVDEIVIATSDRDLALVALRLAELGVSVTGIGEAKAPEDYRKACRKFVMVPVKAAHGAVSVPFDQRMRAFMAAEGKATEGWVAFSALGQQRAKAMDISKAAAGIAKSVSWIEWFKVQPKVYEIEERGTQSRARLKPAK
ncbi:MAG: NYN domain-containing protein [Rhodobacterales bacterium]|nr:NYN domain-containing protein [Rhodobacterales bacterium]